MRDNWQSKAAAPVARVQGRCVESVRYFCVGNGRTFKKLVVLRILLLLALYRKGRGGPAIIGAEWLAQSR